MNEQNPMGEKIDAIRKTVPLPSLFECLAEECSELAQASLKRARILRQENPTPIDEIEAVTNFKEEVNDVILLLNVLGAGNDDEMIYLKLCRWVQRIEDRIPNMVSQDQQVQPPSPDDIPELYETHVQTESLMQTDIVDA